MKVIGNPDGSFVFIFTKDEKPLGISILKSFKVTDEETYNLLAVAIDEVMSAGETKPERYN